MTREWILRWKRCFYFHMILRIVVQFGRFCLHVLYRNQQWRYWQLIDVANYLLASEVFHIILFQLPLWFGLGSTCSVRLDVHLTSPASYFLVSDLCPIEHYSSIHFSLRVFWTCNTVSQRLVISIWQQKQTLNTLCRLKLHLANDVGFWWVSHSLPLL